MASMALQALAVITMLVAVFAQQATALTHYLNWSVENATFTRNCHTVTVPTVNGISPGPTVIITEGDTLVVKVTNNQIYPATLHWHGVRQFGTNYADGPAYITQCPIQQGESYIYEFTVTGQSGTFFYHAHIDWMRATVHGALVVRPKVMPAYGAVEAEIPIVLAEWIGIDPNVYGKGLLDTLAPKENITTITPTVNGNPGPLYNCSTTESITQYKLKPNKVYLLRIINAAMNNDYYFSVGGHKVTVVGADANYLSPFRTNVVAIIPGQTTDVLLITSKTPGKYYFGFDVGPSPKNVGFPPPHISALGLFEYPNAKPTKIVFPTFPNNVTLKPMDKYVAKLKNLNKYALKKTPDQDLIYVVDNAVVACKPSENCTVKIMGAIQNITFDRPTSTSILQAYASGTNGVFTADFPDLPETLNISVTGPDPLYTVGSRGTRVKELNYNDVVQVVFQNDFGGKGILDHPFHLHGHDFYVVGREYGIYNPSTDPAKFNLVNPPLFNTFGIPNGGWIAVRFHANNPGAWLLHCHFERHIGWGMEMVFITKNGGGQSLKAPLHPLPSCTA